MVILVFTVGQLAVDQVAQCIVGVFDAVVFFEAVAAADVVAFALSFCHFVGKDVVGGVEGEGFAAAGLAVACLLNMSDFVVNVIEDAASLVGALNEVAGFVVGVAAVDGAAGQRVLFAVKRLCAAPDGMLAFQTTHGVVVVQTADAALRPLDFAVQFVAFDVGYDFAVEADLVQVSAAVVQVIDMAAVGQDGAFEPVDVPSLGTVFQMTSMLTVNKIVKEQMVQTTSKKVLRSSEKQKPRACVPYIPYVRTEGFVWATACYL